MTIIHGASSLKRHLRQVNLPNHLKKLTYVQVFLGNQMAGLIHLVKLSVGSEGVEDLRAWQATKRAQAEDGAPRHVTRMWPKREADLLKGGSIYWVIKGQLQCRQKILRLDEIYREDGIRRCAIVLDPEIIRTHLAQKRPFQGWRYLKPEQAPADLPSNRQDEEDLPVELAGALADIGVF